MASIPDLASPILGTLVAVGFGGSQTPTAGVSKLIVCVFYEGNTHTQPILLLPCVALDSTANKVVARLDTRAVIQVSLHCRRHCRGSDCE
jgi:hypothetical protein